MYKVYLSSFLFHITLLPSLITAIELNASGIETPAATKVKPSQQKEKHQCQIFSANIEDYGGKIQISDPSQYLVCLKLFQL